jgi:hypothetical protein
MTFGENFENHDNLESIMVHVEKEWLWYEEFTL